MESSSQLERLIEVRNHLDNLRVDKSKYIQSSTASRVFEKLTTIVTTQDIHDLRNMFLFPTRDRNISEEVTALHEILLILSLTYMTVGKNNELPAIYTILFVTQLLLHHLTETSVYSRRDLKTLEQKFLEIDKILNDSIDPRLSPWIGFWKDQLETCVKSLQPLKEKLDGLSPVMDPLYERLVSLRRQIMAAGSRLKVVNSELKELLVKLSELEDFHATTAYTTPDGGVISGQNLIAALINQCRSTADDIYSGQLKIDGRLVPTQLELINIKTDLEKLALTWTWSMRETDLFESLQRLRHIDEQRVDGKFIGVSDDSPEQGQHLLLYLLRKSYAIIYELLYQSLPIAESLHPIHNQLATLKKCLIEVQSSGGVSSPRDLFPFSIKLASIDNLRKDGIFYAGNKDGVPEGQGIVNGLLEECYEICHQLRRQAEDNQG